MSHRALILAAILIVMATVLLLLRANDGPKPPRFLGYIEAESALIGPKASGRLAAIAIQRGDVIVEGQPLFRLDAEIQQAQVAEAKARLSEARARLADRLASKLRPAQIAVLVAARQRAAAALELSEAEYRRQKTLFDRGVVTRARLDQAEAALKRDRAALAEIVRQIEAARLASREAEIEAAEAGVAAAKAALAQAQTILDERSVVAPKRGRVLDVFFRLGEVVAAGQPVVELLPPENLYVRFYVPETAIAAIAPGERVAVACDGCPENLKAEIVFIAPEAEFTPPVIFTREERAKLVFLVKARPLANPRNSLKAGLPVEVTPIDAAIRTGHGGPSG